MSAPVRERLSRWARGRVLRWLAGPDVDAHVRGLARSSRVEDHVVFGDPQRVTLAHGVILNDALLNVTSGTITLHEAAFLGHGVSLLTGTHDVTALGFARQQSVPPSGRDIVIGAGAWLASGVTVLGPCVIGEHAVVAAGTLVTHDVEPFAIVAGLPARPVGRVPRPPAAA